MVAKKGNGKSQKRSTSMAMSDVLNRRDKSTKAIERIVDKNIASEVPTKHINKSKEKPSRLSDIAVDVAARRRAGKSAPKKAKAVSTAKKTVAGINKKPLKTRVQKSGGSSSIAAKEPALKKPAAKAPHNERASIEVITLGAGLFKAVNVAVGGLFDAGKAVTGFAGSVVAKAPKKPMESRARSAKEKVDGEAVKSGKRGARVKPQNKKVDQSPVSSALTTASEVTGKVASGAATLGSGVGKAAGYVVTGALAAPVDIVSGVIGIGTSATGSMSRLLFAPRQSRSSKPEKRKKIPLT